MPSISPAAPAISATSAETATASPPRAAKKCGLQQPAQRIAQPCTHSAKRRPGPSHSVMRALAPTRTCTAILHVLHRPARCSTRALRSEIYKARVGPAVRLAGTKPSVHIGTRFREPRRLARTYFRHQLVSRGREITVMKKHLAAVLVLSALAWVQAAGAAPITDPAGDFLG